MSFQVACARPTRHTATGARSSLSCYVRRVQKTPCTLQNGSASASNNASRLAGWQALPRPLASRTFQRIRQRRGRSWKQRTLHCTSRSTREEIVWRSAQGRRVDGNVRVAIAWPNRESTEFDKPTCRVETATKSKLRNRIHSRRGKHVMVCPLSASTIDLLKCNGNEGQASKRDPFVRARVGRACSRLSVGDGQSSAGWREVHIAGSECYTRV